MLQTYRAIIHGDKIEWKGNAPPPSREPLSVEITVIPPSNVDVLASGQEMARLLEEISKQTPFRDIKDPVAWQREIRKDRPLPGREED